MTITKDLGAVSAYAYAVEKGYTGTEEEYAELMASYATVAEQASQSAQTATEKASEASQSASDAQIAKTASETAKGIAESARDDAQQSATTASQKAQEASQSAQTASKKASEASQSASESSQSASTAVQAKQDAQTAKTASETAQASAESARDDAESARDEAQQYAESIDPQKLIGAYPVDTATGAIASFPDGADNIPMKKVTVRIEPKQAGTGDPSPENICPISGWTEVDVEQSGVNVWDEEWEVGGINSSNGANWNTIDRIRSKNYVLVKANASYYIKASTNLSIMFYDANKGYISFLFFYPTDNVPFKTPQNCAYVRFALQPPYGTTYNNDISINYHSTDHEYHPYTGRSININLGQTVYGGKLDVLSGELTVYPYYASYNGETLTGEWISDRDKYVAGTTPTIGAQVVNIGASGVTVQLSANQINSLYGVNNIWADSGDTEVVYRADTKLYISKKITEAISALS